MNERSRGFHHSCTPKPTIPLIVEVPFKEMTPFYLAL